MFVGRIIPFKIIFSFAWRSWLVYLLYSTALVLIYKFLCKSIVIPFLPISLIGTAVAFLIGFKNNSSYERLWEARRIWGSIINASRTLGIFVTDTIVSNNDSEIEKIKKEILYRHIGYVNAIRVQLRSKTVWDMDDVANKVVRKLTHFHTDSLLEELSKFIDKEELDTYKNKQNVATHIMATQNKDLAKLKKMGAVSELNSIEIAKLYSEFYNQQGACERIKSFPFPRQYAFFSRLFVYVFIAILPFGLLNEFAKLNENMVWLTIPFNLIVSWIFFTMEVVGDTSENPFENGINDVPLTAMCRTIEIDLMQMMNEPNVPERIVAENKILM
jgi:ion channel-forming bestrophin family protein